MSGSTTEGRGFSQLVVVGSSAGGIEALSRLVAKLPEDFAAPVVIAQHLDPQSKSHLTQILARRSTLPVRTVEDAAPLEPGVVFVVPANRHVRIDDYAITLVRDGGERPMPSVDRLMESSAQIFGERLIAVVLTGTGNDGTQGARAVRRAGGTVIVQDPESAEFGGMPGSLAPSTVDIVAEVDRIGPVLRDLVSGDSVSPGKSPADEQQELAGFLEALRERHGMDFTSYKTPTIMRRLKRRIVATGTESIEGYSAYLEQRPGEYRQLINSFLIKVTEFFRDRELFDYVRDHVLPELVESAREDGRQLRIWSAGCATGEEAYSIAMLVSEALGSDARPFNVRIFATDADEEAVAYARHGLYPASALSGLGEDEIERHFTREGNQYQVKKEIRSMIVFGEHDLARRSPFPRIDLVLSRNVLIYFTAELQRRALQLFAYSLRDGGYLIMGKAETPGPLGEFFSSADNRHKVFRRHGERFLMPPNVPTRSVPLRHHPERRPLSPLVYDTSEMRRELRQARLADENLINGLPVGIVVVDRRYDIQLINSMARRLLAIHGVATNEDLLHLLQNVPYEEVRSAIDAALGSGERTHTDEFRVEDVASGEVRYLQISCYPQDSEGVGGSVQTATVVVLDTTESVRERRELEGRLEALRADVERLRRETEEEASRQRAHVERQVTPTRQLELANRELSDLNEEFRAANEDSLLSTEEAQAATEEVETLNEELQATNEELETLNEELQATVEELNTTNDDLQARSAELQDLARNRELERRESEAARLRLDATLQSVSDPLIAVNTRVEVLFSNEAFHWTFGEVRAGDTVEDLLSALAPLDEGGGAVPDEMTPRYRAARGESFETRLSLLLPDGERRSFEIRGRPVDDGGEGGGVVVFRELPNVVTGGSDVDGG